MQTYYVIWRGDEDDFFVTALDIPKEVAVTLTSKQFVQMAYDAEYNDFTEPNPFVGPNPAPYEVITVFTNAAVQFLEVL